MHSRKPIKPHSFSKFLILSMASLFLLALLSLLLFFSLSSASHHHSPRHSPPHFPQPITPKPSTASVPPQIHQACAATRYTETCEASLIASNRVPPDPKPIDVIQSALWVSLENLKTAQSMVKDILDASARNLNRTTAAKNCLEVLHNSEYRISSTMEALPHGKIKDARAWVSAALLYQYDCWSALKYANDTQQVNKTMSFLDSLLGLSSNGLSIMESYDIFGNDIGSWRPPKTERDGFWEPSGLGEESGLGVKGGVPTGLPPDATVCKDGNGCYKTVQEAVDAAPANAGDRKFVIRIREGVYEETVRVPLEKKNVVFLGDGMGKTVITGSLNAGQPGISTYNTATVGVSGDGFMASGLTFQNTAGPDAHQAVAFRSGSDLSVIENCEFLGNQDTLYAHSLRQFYKSCNIQGNVDFIFGNSASIFQDCLILIRPRQLKPEKGENNAVTAHGRTDPAQTTGFVFQNCVVNGTDDYMKLYYSNPKVHKNFLGRPWKEFSRTVFIRCFLEALVTPQGWLPWSGDFALETLYYGEFNNSGLGANLSARVTWSSQIPAQHINMYSVQNFIQGVSGDGFMASGLTFQNTAGPDAHQAVAFRSGSDLSVIENCEFLGNQDTLYAESLRQFYKSCNIQGNVDFIFGNSASIFQDCLILIRPRQLNPEKGENNAVTAHSRTDPAQTTGFVFQNCVVNGTDDYMKLYYSNPKVHKNFLGRPWKEFSRTVFIQCSLEALVTPQGWLPWSGDFALETLYYGEFNNSGLGANLSARVTWSSQIPAQHINMYSVQNFIQGNEWIPTTS